MFHMNHHKLGQSRVGGRGLYYQQGCEHGLAALALCPVIGLGALANGDARLAAQSASFKSRGNKSYKSFTQLGRRTPTF
jgi:hypothetical protein